MSIYVHYSENSRNLKDFPQVYPGLVIFKELHEIEPYFKSHNEIESFICFTEDSLLIKQLSIYNHVLVISESVFLCILKELKLIYKKHSLFNFFKGVVLTFSEFQEDDKIIILKAKAILMGARLTNNVSALTHVIPYRMSGSIILMIRELHKNVKIYDKFFIEYYWNNCLTILSPYRELNNELVENLFKGRLFMNCRIILLGFDEYSLLSMIRTIKKNGGSIIKLLSINEATHIIYPFNYLSMLHIYRKEFNSIPASLHKNIVHDKWFELSVSTGCLLSLENYQFFNATHVSFLNNIQPDNIVFQDVDFIENDEIFDVHIEKDSIGYDPRRLTEAQIDDHNTQRLNNVKELVNYFKDKDIFFNDFIVFLVSLETEYRSLQIVIEHFAEIVRFYRYMHEILDIEIESIDEDTFIGMIANTGYSSVADYHKKFIINFEKIENQLKKTIKENVMLKEKFDVYLHKINYSADGLINRPMLLLPRINMIIGEIMKHSPYCHPDMKYLKEMSDKTVEVLRYHSSLMTMDMENNKQAMISKCIDKPICSGGSQFVSVVDCMLIEDDGLRTSTSMFLFTDKIILSKICNTSLAFKRFSNISSYLKSHNDDNVTIRDSFDGSLSRCSSSLSLCLSPTSSIRSKNTFTRKESTKSTSSNTEKSPFYIRDAIKFSKLFCGLSRLSLWGNSTPVLYHSNIIYQSRVVKVISHIGGDTIESKLYFTLNMAATENENVKQLKFLLVPRIVKNFSEYEKINTVFENDLSWDASGLSGINWAQFIVDEKHKFCELVARLFNGSVIEDYSNLVSNHCQYGSQRSLFSNDSFSFMTPHSKSKTSSISAKDNYTTPEILKTISKNFVNGIRSVRKSLCSKATNKTASLARASKGKYKPDPESILETPSDLASPEQHRRTSMVIKSEDKENSMIHDDFFRTPKVQKKASKRKSRDIDAIGNKNPRF